jgi:zinc D-Ala-D-Ala carboxypeptidase
MLHVFFLRKEGTNMKKIVYSGILVSVLLLGCQNEEDAQKDVNDQEQIVEDNEDIAQDETPEESPAKDEEVDGDIDKEINQSEKGEEIEEDVPVNGTQTEDGLTVVPDPNSIDVIVNKQRKLPDGYEPTDLVEPNVDFYAEEGDPKRLIRKVAATALEELFQTAETEGLDLVAVSGYRSYDRQKVIYENNVATNGQEHADKYSAKPGTSEHQTGLTMDVASAALVSVLEPSFIQTDEGKWLADNAHRFGFVIRYPEGKEAITGYSYEPWHIRYVGKDVAKEVYEANLTLEEFFGLYP